MDDTIFHIEDNPDDAVLMSIAFQKAGSVVQLKVAADGHQAMDLFQTGELTAPPACVLLDIKLPDMSGLEVLRWIRTQKRLRRLPVVIFSSSSRPDDVVGAYEAGANGYLVKPSSLAHLSSQVQALHDFWIVHNHLP